MQIYHLDLQELTLFRDVSAEEVDRFIMSMGATVKRYEKGTRILKAYEPNANIGVMVEGKAQVIAEDRFGNESIGHILERGAMMGSASAILPRFQSNNNTSIEALTDVPVFLPAISLTAGAFGGGAVTVSYLGGMALYDFILLVGASMLFDYLWYED